MTNKNRKPTRMQWYRMDLHLHTPASADYQEPDATYLDVLKRAEMRGLDIIAFTDHNTVSGYSAMMAEIHEMEILVQRERALPDEKRRLAEYRRLLDRILVLPGFEFTATFGFHILGIFSPSTPVRLIEHILLNLHISPQTLDEGNMNVGASSDVLTAYRAINEAGGIVIAAHANSTHGVAMRGFDFGGQTRIAYTQDAYLHCLEVTDLDRRGRGTTSRFFDGSKPEYPRRMRCIQGSDAHRLVKDPRREKDLGIGDRVTEIQLDERSFEALRDVLRGTDFARTRPYRGGGEREVYDYVHQAREAGPSIVQAFHDRMERSGGRLYAIVADVAAMANTNGGTIYVGVAADLAEMPMGVNNIGESIEILKNEIAHRIAPPLDVEIDALDTQGKAVIRIQVPRGPEPPYALDEHKIYVRAEAETSLAVRDEIVALVRKTMPARPQPTPSAVQAAQSPPLPVVPDIVLPPVPALAEAAPAAASAGGRRTRRARGGQAARAAAQQAAPVAAPPRDEPAPAPAVTSSPVQAAPPPVPALSGAPRTGVEIVGTETRKGEQYHIMRDLRDGKIVKNVTRSSARRLWHYAITELESNPVNPQQVQWSGDIGLWKRHKRAGVVRYDLVMAEGGNLRVFYGVTEDGMHGPWQQFISDEDVPDEEAPVSDGE
ncbi:MAG: putative DNA binding domain-containing protein [Anaerolineae bacterium]|nr:putative DNA binding domain-containing protein [Anaerolineae bacterium]